MNEFAILFGERFTLARDKNFLNRLAYKIADRFRAIRSFGDLENRDRLAQSLRLVRHRLGSCRSLLN
ncbi:hypothetical protein B0G74_6820 [Paraburkholderia sp. BL9I2N2]|jgi:hypothetical protein|nr:hypothetical protein B0G74_6820 [Paraburkholderia sp. BL9I2N2]